MATQWICPKGHQTESVQVPAECPICGDTLHEPVESPRVVVQATVDFPRDIVVDLPHTLQGTPEVLSPIPVSVIAVPSVGVEVPGYEILGELGRGGMGVVYKARQVGLNRLVALKMILAAEHAGPSERTRFQTEAEAVAQLHHPNIVQIYEVGEADGRPYFSLEFVDGGSLAAKIQSQPQQPRASAALIENLARAVAVAHGVGIIHRDLKPANVLLADPVAGSDSFHSLSSLTLRATHPFGIPKITDFGLAKRLEGGSGQTQSGSIMGTPSYMAPEQAAGKIKEIGPPTDVYALGVILYEMLTGRVPFHAETPLDTIMQVLRDEPVPPHSLQPKLPRDLDIICLKCLEKNPAKRYPNAIELANDLARFLDGEPISARAASRTEKVRKWMRRHPASTLVIGLILAGLTLIGFGGYVYHEKLQQALSAAQRERDNLAIEKKRDVQRAIRLTVANGTQSLNQGDLMRALPAFAEALRLEGGLGENEEMHRIRLAAVLRQCPRLPRAWFHDGRVNDAAFSPDGQFVLTACEDGYARMFRIDDLAIDRPALTLSHSSAVLQARFSPKGTHIVTVSADFAARLWDVQTGKMIAEPLRHADVVTSVNFDTHGTRVLTTSADRTARVWDVATGEATAIILKHNGGVNQGEFSPDGESIATASQDGTARVWNASTGKPVSPVLVHKGPVICAHFGPQGKRVLTASQDQTARVWNAETGEGLSLWIKRASPLTDAAFSPNGRDVVTAGSDGVGRVWDTLTNDWRTYYIRHDSQIIDIEISPDGRMMATGGNDNTARVWEVTRGEPITPPLRHNGSVYRVVFSADGSHLLTASQDGMVRLWDIAAGRRVDNQPASSTLQRREVTYSPDRRKLLRIERGEARLFDAGTQEPMGQIMKHHALILYATFSPDGKRVLTASADRTAQVWDSETGEPIGARLHHGSDVVFATFSHDGKQVGTASDDNTARVWKAETGESITPPLRHFATVTRIVFSPDGRCVLTTGEDHTARTWDAVTGESLTPVMKPTGWMAQVLGSNDASGGWDLPPDRRSVEHLVLLSQWLSAQQIDKSSGLVPLDIGALWETWNTLRNSYPEELSLASDHSGWHRQEAIAAEKARDWFGAVFHLTWLLESCDHHPSDSRPKLFGRRGRAWAEQANWKKAASDFGSAIEAGANDEATLSSHALTLWASQDEPGYRKACETLLEHYGESAHGESAWRLVWVSVLAKSPVKALNELSLHSAHGGKHESPNCYIAIGAVLARQGKWDKAVESLEEGYFFADSVDAVRAWLFLAIAHRELGNDSESSRWHHQAERWLERNCPPNYGIASGTPTTIPWQVRLELLSLENEVRRTLKDQPPARIPKLAP